MQGRIGGGVNPFVAERAVFTLADLSLPPCDANPDDKCPTPWDYCCEPQDKIVAASVSVQVADDAGKPLKLGLNGVNGLRPGGELIVKGRVASKDGNSLVVSATTIFVKK